MDGSYSFNGKDPYTLEIEGNGIRCNMFWSDDPVEAVEMLKSGIDCILTNDYLAVKVAVEKCS